LQTGRYREDDVQAFRNFRQWAAIPRTSDAVCGGSKKELLWSGLIGRLCSRHMPAHDKAHTVERLFRVRRAATFRGLWAVQDFPQWLRTLGGQAGIQRGTRMRRTSSTHFAAAMTVTVLLLSGLLELAKAAEYRPTFCGDIIMGYVPLGERVRKVGYGPLRMRFSLSPTSHRQWLP
jgi:hypothetical protein